MMGASNAELWNNWGLCCFYAGQYDMIFRCFENALLVADDTAQADVWCGRTSASRAAACARARCKHACTCRLHERGAR